MPDAVLYFSVGSACPKELLIGSSVAFAMTVTAFVGTMLWDWIISPEWVEAEPPAERTGQSGDGNEC